MLKITFLMIALMQAAVEIAVAQTSSSTNNPTSTKTVKAEPDFVSVEGEFTIALPEKPIASRSVEPLEGKTKGGSQFFWDTSKGIFTIGFVNLFKAQDGKEVAETTAADLIEQTLSDGGKLLSKKEIAVNGNPGLEITMRLKTSVIVIGRHIIVGSRIYSLTSGWRETESGGEQIKVLDSFKVIDAKTALAKSLEIKKALAKKIEDATPAPLPQSPVAAKLKSDAEDDGLKGKVKSVIEEREELSDGGIVASRNIFVTEDYNEQGSRLKRVNYDYRGNPYYITVYGYIDGARVSNSKSIDYEYDPPGIAVKTPQPVEQPQKPADKRYQLKYEYKYENGKLVEMQLFGNNGTKGNRYIYIYNGNQKEQIVYTADGKINQKYIKAFDDKGNEIELTIIDILEPKVYGDAKYKIKYESFDANGNWTKSTFLRLVIEDGKEVYKPRFTKYRTITYYP